MPLISRRLSQSWEAVSERLSNTLDSALQLDPSIVSISVVGHDIPGHIKFGDRCRWVPVTFNPPSIDSLAEKMNDKGQKTMAGIKDAFQNRLAEWVMFMDADDFVSRDLLKIVDLEAHDAVCLKRGYRWRLGDERLEVVHGFHRRCGTSWMMRLEPRMFPVWLGEGGERVCDQAHNNRLEGLRKAGARVQMLRKPAVVYLTGHGGNAVAVAKAGNSGLRGGFTDTLRRIRSRMRSKLITPAIREEFGLPDG